MRKENIEHGTESRLEWSELNDWLWGSMQKLIQEVLK